MAHLAVCLITQLYLDEGWCSVSASQGCQVSHQGSLATTHGALGQHRVAT